MFAIVHYLFKRPSKLILLDNACFARTNFMDYRQICLALLLMSRPNLLNIILKYTEILKRDVNTSILANSTQLSLVAHTAMNFIKEKSYKTQIHRFNDFLTAFYFFKTI